MSGKAEKRAIETGDPIIDRLYAAAVEYVESRGGTAVVVGGVAIVQENPSRRPYRYGVVVGVTGKVPRPTPEDPGGDEG